MTRTQGQTAKSKPASASFFRPAAMQNPPPVSLDAELLARPLSFKLVFLTLAAMVVVAAIYLGNVDFSSTHTASGDTVRAPDGSIQFVVVALPETARLVSAGNRATVRFDAYPSDSFGAIEATIVSIDSTREEASGSPRVRMALRLDQEFLEGPDSKAPLQSGLSGRAQLVVETKSLLAWIIQYLRPREEP